MGQQGVPGAARAWTRAGVSVSAPCHRPGRHPARARLAAAAGTAAAPPRPGSGVPRGAGPTSTAASDEPPRPYWGANLLAGTELAMRAPEPGQRLHIARQLGEFLRILHGLEPDRPGRRTCRSIPITAQIRHAGQSAPPTASPGSPISASTPRSTPLASWSAGPRFCLCHRGIR